MTRRAFVSALRARCVYLGYRTGAEGMRVLPEPAAQAAATVVGRLLTVLHHESREIYAKNLARALGESLPRHELQMWTRRVFANYARYWLEGARIASLPPQLIRDRMVVESGYDYLVEGMASGKGVVLALPHVGAWEWGGAWLALQGYPMTSVAEPVEPKALYDFFVGQREAMGLHIVPMDRSAGGELLRVLREGRLVGLLCDRDIAGNGVEVEFFGERTTLPGGPATLALRTGASLLPAAVYIGPGKGHTAVIMPPVNIERTASMRADVTRVTQELTWDLESLIRRAPDQWYLFQPNWPSDRPGQRAGST